jgi:polysaccharide export outer membrane protein
MKRGVFMHLTVALAIANLAGCATRQIEPGFARGADADRLFGSGGAGGPVDYRIAPLDVLRVQVLNEAQLSADRVQVDAAGDVMLPLVGQVRASGLNSAELAAEFTRRLDRYLRRPDVTVTILSATRQRVVVEGFVADPGVFEIAGTATLLEMLARAKSPTNRAATEQIVVIRMLDGRRQGAVFNLNRIRAGLDPDPTILGGDRIVVGYSSLRGAFRDFLEAAPVIAIFRPF